MQLYAVFAASYILLITILPANKQAMHTYHLSTLEYRVLYFAVAIPAVAVWFAAFFGYAKLQEYAASIKNSSEAGAFAQLATGCRWLAWSLPIPALTAVILNSIANSWPGFHSTAIILNNYVSVILSLIAFSVIGFAARELAKQSKIQFSATSARGIMLVFVVGGVAYCYLTFRRFDPNSLGSTNNPYALPIWLMLLTVIIPYLYAWFVGLLASYEITTYTQQVRGVLYKQALHLLVGGLVAVIIGSICLQYISSVEPSPGHLTLNYRLLLITLFRVVDGVGFVLIAIGALRLRKIEEV